MIKELAVERYAFTCRRCSHHWTRDYDVQHVVDGSGRVWGYYSLNGSPACAPTAPDAVACPSCGAEHVDVSLAAIRRVPIARPAAGEAPSRPGAPARQDRFQRDLAVERYAFTCPHCSHRWTRDYDVQHVVDNDQNTWGYYSFNGMAALAPTAPGAIACSSCGAEHLYVSLAAIRTIPSVHPADDHPFRHLVTEADQARRDAAPLLPGHDVAHDRPGEKKPSAGDEPHRYRAPEYHRANREGAPLVLSNRGSYLAHSRVTKAHQADREAAPLLPGDAPLAGERPSGEHPSGQRASGDEPGTGTAGHTGHFRLPAKGHWTAGAHGLLRRPHLPLWHRHGAADNSQQDSGQQDSSQQDSGQQDSGQQKDGSAT